MSEGKPKPEIPAWQRAPIRPATADTPHSDTGIEGNTTETSARADEPAAVSEEPESVPSSDTSPTTAPTADAYEAKQPAFEIGDFSNYLQQEKASRAASQQARQTYSSPPIITYPEFLVDAHKPPPLITPARVLNSVYAAGAVAALCYGASKWLINPMVENLAAARHDFLGHGRSKVDEMNTRLEGLVSKIPDVKKTDVPSTVDDAAEVDSQTSDPTELYHRDMGTQTSPPASRRPSFGTTAAPKKDPVTQELDAMARLKTQIDELADGLSEPPTAAERQHKINQLRHYLDGMIYGGAQLSAWHISDDAAKSGQAASEDAIEELKKEIRSVKGVLLSAKRFPAVSKRVPVAA